jgi:hypothetical protein
MISQFLKGFKMVLLAVEVAIMMGEDALGDNNVENVYSNDDFVSAKAMNVVWVVAMAMTAVEMVMTKAPVIITMIKAP